VAAFPGSFRIVVLLHHYAVAWLIGLFGHRVLAIAAMAGFALVLLGMSALALNSFKAAVILTDDVIQVRGIMGTKTLRFDQIRGVSKALQPGLEESPDCWRFTIEPIDDDLGKIAIDETFGFDDAFHQWIRGLPNLDATDTIRPGKSRVESV
jgi:hypothetical protein